jgi:two-component sensor histidine kinase
MSNALKHAFPHGRQGRIGIVLRLEEVDWLRLEVSDDGIGIGDGFEIERTTTLGLQLVTLLADQLGGALAVRRSNPTRFTLRFPINKK